MTIALATDNGNHPPASWAQATAQTIIDLGNVPAQRQAAGQELQANIAYALTGYYSAVLDREKDHLALYHDHCDSPYDVSKFVKMALIEITDLARDTPWETLILSEPWQQTVYSTIGDHLASAIHVERLLYGDAHPDNSSAMAYRHRFHK